METFIQPKITGYRQLNETEAALMNEIKELGPAIEAVCGKIKQYLDQQKAEAQEQESEGARLASAEPHRWLYWGRDGMQSNLMFLTRAVAQPTAF